MPRTISEIKEFTSKKSMENIHDDPAKNSLMANIKKLNDELFNYQNNMEVRALRERLGNILDSYNGKEPENVGNFNLDQAGIMLETVYMTKIINQHSKIADEKKYESVKQLIEHVSAGIGVKSDWIPVTDKLKEDVAFMERQGRREVLAEKAAEEEQARRDALKGKSALNLLDEYKAGIGKLPKSFKGAGMAAQEAEARKQLTDLCIDIMAARRSVDAQRNNKKGLEKASLDADHLYSIKQDFARNEALKQFLDGMSYKDLRELAYSGHGGAMEEQFAKYLRTSAKMPEKAPEQYMPTAKERIEALQDQMDTQSFRRTTPPSEQRKLYVELLAARAAVGAKRNQVATLNPKLDPTVLDRERKVLEQEPLKTALVRMTLTNDRRESALGAATKGHGGGLEDQLRTEVRRMALEKESGYKMQQVDLRYAPTYAERTKDLNDLIESPQTPTQVKFRAIIERNILETAQKDYSADTPINKVDAINAQVDSQVALYGKVMQGQEMEQFVANAREHGYDEACKIVDDAHIGQMKAIRLREQLDSQLEAGPEKQDLPKIAAQKMTLLQHWMDFADTKDDAKLAKAMDPKQFNGEVNKLMSHHLFKEVCDKLGTEGLQDHAKGSGFKLIDCYNLAKEDKLMPYKPAAEPVVKHEEPQKGNPMQGLQA